MHSDLLRAAHAVFLPAFDHWDVDAVMDLFLAGGGCSILIGESREEYLARRMSNQRRDAETAEFFRQQLERLKAKSGKLIVALDEELGGIRRLEGLVPDLPSPSEATAMSDNEIEARCFENARTAHALGVTMYLAPVIDVVNGDNPWLKGRTLGSDASEIARIGAAYVRGVQRAGIAAVAKHFPGYNHLAGDPAEMVVSLDTAIEPLTASAQTFAAAISAGAKAVMVGPAPVVALDPDNAACVSPAVINFLREHFGFDGLIVSDDLDGPSALRGNSLLDTAIAGLKAGADLLLVAGGPHLEELCRGVALAATDGRLPSDRLEEAAERVRAMSGR